MALSPTEITALRPIVAREGLHKFLDEVLAQAILDKKIAAITTLGNAVSVTVSDWVGPATYVAGATNDTLVSVIQDITVAWTEKDQTKLGALFVQLFAAAKKHLNL